MQSFFNILNMRVFFIGVCGTAMGNAAILFKKMGHAVAGSDAGVYPPMSDVLESAGIKLLEGFAQQDMLDYGNLDRVVVGNAVSRGNPQVEYLLRTRQNRSYLSSIDWGRSYWKTVQPS